MGRFRTSFGGFLSVLVLILAGEAVVVVYVEVKVELLAHFSAGGVGVGCGGLSALAALPVARGLGAGSLGRGRGALWRGAAHFVRCDAHDRQKCSRLFALWASGRRSHVPALIPCTRRAAWPSRGSWSSTHSSRTRGARYGRVYVAKTPRHTRRARAARGRAGLLVLSLRIPLPPAGAASTA